MKNKPKTYAFITLLLLAVVLTVTAVSPKRSSAYFTDYTTLKGEVQLNYLFREEIHEEPKGLTKEFSVRNSGNTEVVVRVKVLKGTQIAADYQGTNWTPADDGYVYYGTPASPIPVAPGEETALLKIVLKPADDFKSDFNVVVAEETVPALYHEDSTPYADWDAELIEVIK